MSTTLTLAANETRQEEARKETCPPVRILIVDDSPMDRRLAGAVVEKHTGWKALYASSGLEALPMVEHETPDLILTDMLMPEMNGLELLHAVRQKNPEISVVMMTASGSEDLANHALRYGAASYVPKTNLARDLCQTLEEVLAAGQGVRKPVRLASLARMESDYILENDPGQVRGLLMQMREDLVRLDLCLRTSVRIGVALGEAMSNGIIHGNLELGSNARKFGERAFLQQVEERRTQIPYRDRRLFLKVKLSRTEAVFVVRDEGPGFDHSRLAKGPDPAQLSQAGGRGFALIRSFMDEVTYNEVGNEITLVKRNDPPVQLTHEFDSSEKKRELT